MYIIIGNANEYTEESNGNKYFTLVPTVESKDTLQKVWKCESNSKMLLDQQVIAQLILLTNIWKSDSVQMMICLRTKH